MVLRAYVRERALYGSEFKISKCWSHVATEKTGRITMGNNLADAQANKGRADCSGMEHSASAFQLDVSLVDNNGLVDLAPKRAI